MDSDETFRGEKGRLGLHILDAKKRERIIFGIDLATDEVAIVAMCYDGGGACPDERVKNYPPSGQPARTQGAISSSGKVAK